MVGCHLAPTRVVHLVRVRDIYAGVRVRVRVRGRVRVRVRVRVRSYHVAQPSAGLDKRDELHDAPG